MRRSGSTGRTEKSSYMSLPSGPYTNSTMAGLPLAVARGSRAVRWSKERHWGRVRSARRMDGSVARAYDSPSRAAARGGVPRPTYDEAVTVRSRSISHPAGLLYALLVLTVLAGILGMHALPSGPSPAIRSGHGHMAVTADAESGSAPAGLCAHTAGGADHLHHADRTCAAAGVGSPYTPPALSTAFSGSPVAAPWSASVPESALAARASPDLSELQLLRI